MNKNTLVNNSFFITALVIAGLMGACKQGDSEIDAAAKTKLTAKQDTGIKAKLEDLDDLKANEKCLIGRGATIQLASAPVFEREKHYRIRVNSGLPTGCKLTGGLIYGPHFGLPASPSTRTKAVAQSAPGKLVLDVPYFSQHNNQTPEPGNTCGITSTSMVLKFFGINKSALQLWDEVGKPEGQSPDGVARIFARYGLKSHYTYHGTRALIRKQIDAGRPIVVNTYFTSGHVVAIVGYDSNGLYFNDPNGQWGGVPHGSSRDYADLGLQAGIANYHSFSKLAGTGFDDGDIWMAAADTKDFEAFPE